jgi:hypothetical protein
MAKKFGLLMAVTAILAFAIPTLAHASQLTNAGGGATAVGTKITKTSTGAVKFTTALLSTLECSTVTVKGEVTVNSGGTVEGKGTGEGSASGCVRSGSPITVSDTTVTNIKSTTSGSGTASFKTTAVINTTTCNFTGTNVPFTYTSGGDTIVFSEAKGVSSAACGTTKLDGSFTLQSFKTNEKGEEVEVGGLKFD